MLLQNFYLFSYALNIFALLIDLVFFGNTFYFLSHQPNLYDSIATYFLNGLMLIIIFSVISPFICFIGNLIAFIKSNGISKLRNIYLIGILISLNLLVLGIFVTIGIGLSAFRGGF